MTNKALIAQLKGKMKSRKEAGDDVWLDLERAAAALEAQEWRTDMEEAKKQGWIIVFEPSDMLPEHKYQTHWIVRWNHDEWVDQDNVPVLEFPTHWRPLPPAPEGE